MKEADLKLDKFGISKDLFRELKYFCRQYSDKLAELNCIRGLSAAVSDGMPHGSGTSDPTARKAERALRLRQEMEAVEQAAIEADGELYQYIIRHVTVGTPYTYLGIPCGVRQFEKMRRVFYWALAKRLGKL